MKLENRIIEFQFKNRLPDYNRVYEFGEAKSGRVPSGNANAAQRYYMLLSVSKTGNLKNIVLDDAQGVHLGDVFDYNMEQYVTSFWRTGSEANLPEIVRNRLTQLKNDGYELVIKPKVSISGNNPVPDMLFIKLNKQTNKFDFSDCIYIDNKYSPSSPFSSSQNQIITDFSYYPNRPWAEVVLNEDILVSSEIISSKGATIQIKEIQTFGIDDNFNMILNPIKP